MILDRVKCLDTWRWTEAMGEFMDRMNFKAKMIGMDSSSFANPYGGQAFGWNYSTCLDLLRLGIHAYSYPYVMDVLTMKGAADIHVFGEHERDVSIEKDFQAFFEDPYRVIHPEGDNPHLIYGGKGGGWGADGEHKVFAWLMFSRIAGRNVVGVTANVTDDRSVGRINRLKAIIQLCDICEKAIRGESVKELRVGYADYAAAAFLPKDTPSVMLKRQPLDLIFTQEADRVFNPASISKILMAITAYDIVGSNQELYQVCDCDICNDSNYWAFPGDIESVENGLYPILINSNGSNTLALARHCGEKILREKERFGLGKPRLR